MSSVEGMVAPQEQRFVSMSLWTLPSWLPLGLLAGGGEVLADAGPCVLG